MDTQIDYTQIDHTPGSWVSEYCGKDRIAIFKVSDKRRIATIKVKTPKMDEANAALIAAAPELLALLKDIVNASDNGEPYSDKELKEISAPVFDKAENKPLTKPLAKAPEDNKPLTNNEIADIYEQKNGHSAFCKSLDGVIDWAMNVPDVIRYDKEEDLFYKVESK